MFKYILLLLFSFIYITPSFAQQASSDSLERYIANTSVDEDKIIPLAALCLHYHSYGDFQKGIEYAKEAIRLARLQNDHKYGVYAYASLAAIYAEMDSVEQTYRTLDSCKWYIDNTTDVIAKISGLNGLAVIKEMFNDLEGTPDILLPALDLLSQVPKDKEYKKFEFEAKLNFSFYHYYSNIDNQIAKRYLDRSFRASKEIDAPWLQITRINQYWDCYKKMYEESGKSEKSLLDSALYMSDLAMQYYPKERKRLPGAEYAYALYCRADIYKMRGEPDSALFYGNKTIEFTTEISDIKTQVLGYDLLSRIELDKKNYAKAEEFALKGLSLTSDETGVYDILYNQYTTLSDVYKESGNSEKALEAQEKALFFYKKMTTEKYMREAQIAEAKLNVKQKQYELEESRLQNQIYTFYIVLSTILLIGLVLLVIIYKLRLKTSLQKELLLVKENEETQLYAQIKQVEAENVKVEKKNVELLLEVEKNRALLNAYEMNKLQKELLAGNLQLNHKNEVINQIKTNLANEKSTSDIMYIKRLLKEENKHDNNFEEFNEYVKKIHPDFYTKLQEHAQQKLTPLDLKYCTFIFMNLSTKDIASLLYIEAKTVRMTKYRLKQKLGLSKTDDLNLFIQQVI
ncbi:MAG: hypothetical protein QM660_00815 [Dysgonomonas sp.]